MKSLKFVYTIAAIHPSRWPAATGLFSRILANALSDDPGFGHSV